MAKRKKTRGSKPSAIRKVGKITFLYFSGDVGEFIDALTAELKKPGTKQKLAEAFEVTMNAARQSGVHVTGLDGEDT